MTLRDRYPQLQNPKLVRHLVTHTVYAPMALEDQEVPLERVAGLVEQAALRRGFPPTHTSKLMSYYFRWNNNEKQPQKVSFD